MRYILDFVDSLSRDEIDTYCADANITIITQYSGFGNVFLCECTQEPTPNKLIEQITLDDDSIMQLLGIDITLDDSNLTTSFAIEDEKNWWKVASVNVVDFDEEEHDHVVRGFNSTVYILDSGIEASHPEFADAQIENIYSITDEYGDKRGHGTAIASVIAGKTCGLTNTKLGICKIFEPGVDTRLSDLLAGFDAVATHYMNGQRGPSVLNLSWSIPKNDYVNSKINQLLDLGLFVIVSAGNSGLPIGHVTPASIPNVLTIGSFNQMLEPSDFSNYTGTSIISNTSGETNTGSLDGWAPGEQIWAAGLQGTYGFTGGTSIAAALASGAFAYNMARYNNEQGPMEVAPVLINYSARRAFIAESNSVVKQTEGDAFTPYFGYVLGKLNMIDLSDPKYASSVNRSISYNSGFMAIPEYSLIYGWSGRETVHSVVQKFHTARIVSEDSLPSWAEITSAGTLYLNPPTDYVPDDEYYKEVGPIELTLEQRDGSIGTLILTFIVLRHDITWQNAEDIIPEDDPVLPISLGVVCSASEPSCNGTGCAPGTFCTYINKTEGCKCTG